MNNFTLHKQAEELSDTVSPYQLAKRLIGAEEQLTNVRLWLSSVECLTKEDEQMLTNVLYGKSQ